LLVAVLLGIAITLSTPITMFYWGVMYFMIWSFWIAAGVGLLLLLGAFQRHCRHRRWRFAIGAVATSTMLNTTVLFDPFDQVSDSGADLVISVIVAFMIIGTIGGLLNIGLAALKDRLVERPKIQDGTLCPTCAYTIVGLPEPRCPECGNRFTPQELEASPPSCKRQWRRVGLASLAGLFLLLGAYFACPYVLIRGLGGSWLHVGGAHVLLRVNPGLSESILCDYLETGDEAERVIGASQLGYLLNQWADRGAPDDRTINLLIHAATEDPVVRVRQMAIQSLMYLSTNALHNVLPQALRDDSADVRWSALACAARGGTDPDARGTPLLIQALDDADQTVRTRAYQRLRANTSQTFPFDPTAPIEQRRAQQEKWQQWWVSQQ
jgi:hypothetical protein